MTPALLISAPPADLDLAFLHELKSAGEACGIDLVGESLQLFLDTTGPRLTALSEALAAGDREGAGLLAHTLRGSCAQFGALRMAHLAGLIEVQVPRQVSEVVLVAAAELQDEFVTVRRALLSAFAGEGPP